MTTRSARYQSPSTPTVNHDLANFIVEAIMINRYGALPAGSWRKDGVFAEQWGQLLTKVKRVGKMGVVGQQMAWFVQFYKITDLDYKEFGLLKWKIQKYFKWCNVDRFVSHYVSLHSTLVGESSNYIEETTGYVTKAASSNRRKSLTDILKELENGDD